MNTPSWSAVATDPEEQRLLMGRRVAYFGRVVFLLSGVFYVRTSIEVYGANSLDGMLSPPHLLHLAAVSMSLAPILYIGFSRLDVVPDPSERVKSTSEIVGMALITMCLGVTAAS